MKPGRHTRMKPNISRSLLLLTWLGSMDIFWAPGHPGPAAALAPQSADDGNAARSAPPDGSYRFKIASPADLAWLDGYTLGAPTRSGAPPLPGSPLIDTAC